MTSYETKMNRMPTYHPGSVFGLTVAPSYPLTVPASSSAVLVIYPGFCCPFAYTTNVSSVLNYNAITPGILQSAGTAASIVGSQAQSDVGFRWAGLCTRLICTTPLSNVGGNVFARRVFTSLDDFTSTGNAASYAYVSGETQANGEPVSAADLVAGLCLHSIINSHKAIDFQDTPVSYLTNGTSGAAAWKAAVVSDTTSPEAADNTTLMWQPIVVFIDNTANSTALGFIVNAECKMEFLPNPASFLSTLPYSVPRTGVEQFVMMHNAASKRLWTPVKATALSRNINPFLGVRSNTALENPSTKAKKKKNLRGTMPTNTTVVTTTTQPAKAKIVRGGMIGTAAGLAGYGLTKLAGRPRGRGELRRLR